jgi:ABC-type Na+ efflux pump permease subunit
MLSILLAMVGGISVTVLAAMTSRETRTLSSTGAKVVIVLYYLALFAVMLLGIVANYYYVHGIKGKPDVNQFWKPIIISPIIYYAVYNLTANQPKNLVGVFLAFQNGFFWQTIIDNAKPPTPTP